MTAKTDAADPALARIVDQVQTARAQHGRLNITGGSTKAFYGGPVDSEAAVLDMRALAGISSYEPSELVVTVRAGTPLAELEAALAEQGQCLPFEPPRFAASGTNEAKVPQAGPNNETARAGGWNAAAALQHGTNSAAAAQGGTSAATAPQGGTNTATAPQGGTVGGMVCAGLAGPARAAVGGVRDYVLGVSLLNGKAELLHFGGTVMKNVAGYDVSRLLVGSLGMLGALCEVSLKVLPVATATRTLRLEMDQATAIQRLNEWGGQPLPLNASAWWEGLLVVRLSGAAAAVRAGHDRLGGEVIEEPLASQFWTGVRDQRDEFFVGAQRAVEGGAGLWRLSLPQVAPPLALPGEQLVEWGGAQRWLCTPLPAAKVREAAAAVGGHATLFRSKDKSAGVFAPLAAPLDRIHRELKAAFDPDGIFNRGRLVPGL